MTNETSYATAPPKGAAILGIVIWMIIWGVLYSICDSKDIRDFGIDIIHFNGMTQIDVATRVPANTDTVLYAIGKFFSDKSGMLGDILFWVWLAFCFLGALFSVSVVQEKRLAAGGMISDDLL